MATLKHQPWPGNVRELQNVVERAVVATVGRTLRLPAINGRPASTPSTSSWRTLAQVQREHIVATLQTTHGVLGGWDGAAARLGLSRTTLISRMQRLGISAQASTGTALPALPVPVRPHSSRRKEAAGSTAAATHAI